MRSSIVASSLILVFMVGCNTTEEDSGSFGSGTDSSSAPTTGVTTTATSQDSSDAGTTLGSTGSDDADSGGAIFDLGNGTGSVEVCGEPEDNPIYVFTRGLETGAVTSIQAFDPPTLTFTPVVASIECDGLGPDWGSSSMGVDRNRGAWISWAAPHDGADNPAYKRLDRINLDTGDCETDVAEFPTTEQWGTPLGMAFVADGPGSGNETLYFVDSSTHLHTIGSKSSIGRWWTLGPEGRTFSGVELTGSGDGRMFSLVMNYTGPFDHECTAREPCLPTVRLAEVDKDDATALSMLDLEGVEAFGIDPGGFAFAYWGGHIWVFLSRDFGPTLVYDHDPEAQTTTLVLEDGVPGVVGAGVSTCAPLILPEG